MSVIPAEGTVIAQSPNGTAWTDIAQVISVQPPGGSVPVVQKTHLGSVAKEKRPGLIPDAGSISMRIQHDPNLTGHRDLRALVFTPEIKYWKITYNDGLATKSNDVFQGFISEWNPSDAEDEANIEVDITIEITGVVTNNAGAGA